MNLITSGLLGAIVVVFLASRNWQQSVKIALVVAVIEGALRKWVLPQASELIYFLKDFLLIGAYIGYFSSSERKNIKFFDNKTITGLIKLVTFICILQALNPSLGSPIIGLFGIRNYLVYVPLIWVFPSLFTTEEELYKFLSYYLLLLIPVGSLAILQFFSPANSPINVYVDDGLTPVGGVVILGPGVRVTGTFSYLAGYSVYLGICLCLLLPMLTRKQSIFWYSTTIIELLLLSITSLMTGSRSLMFKSIFIVISYLILQGSFSRIFVSIRQLFLPFTIAIIIALQRFSTAVEAFWQRASYTQDIPGRIADMFQQPLENFQYTNFSSFGTGATFQANPAIRYIFSLPPGEPIRVYYEGETGRIALELGLIGFLAWYGLKLAIIVAFWKTYRRLKQSFFKQLCLSLFLYQSISFTGQIVFNHTANIFHWFLTSFLFLLPLLDQQILSLKRINDSRSMRFLSSSYK